MSSKVDYVFIGLLDICISSLVNYLTIRGAQFIFLNGMFIFFLMMDKSSLHISNVNFALILHHIYCPLSLLIHLQKLMILNISALPLGP